MANPELGAKQICPSCAAKFYDLGRRPAVCPKCATQFDPEEALRNRRVRARTAAPEYEAEEEKKEVQPVEADGFEDEVEETPEVDEAVAEPIVAEEDGEEVEGGSPAAPADELGVDFAEEEEELEEESAEVPFLVDEDDEDDNFEDEIEGLPDDEPD